ncbi:hypothetical protein N7462_010727 [Penicillium macrosclerotiorum]|uniref:uncharacterized protein n=1 Tax=Penicillium macrosclerotiorum TaxID=303699 RepID=UPI0025493805|nr:uncharacterized protein N7462_010727 [Penicillium macrosclerotiorum]KAJ5669657.1 hypothetical protein N7462_010727 [Penicillium macrosclerotiorum]
MSPLLNPLPIIIFGRSAQIGKVVQEGLAPRYEVIHFFSSATTATTDLPRLLAGQEPQSPDDSGIGTRNYANPARAVVFGRGYDNADVDELRKISEGSNKDPVVWLMGDPEKRPAALTPGPGYAQAAAKDARDILDTWKKNGGVRDEVLLW